MLISIFIHKGLFLEVSPSKFHVSTLTNLADDRADQADDRADQADDNTEQHFVLFAHVQHKIFNYTSETDGIASGNMYIVSLCKHV